MEPIDYLMWIYKWIGMFPFTLAVRHNASQKVKLVTFFISFFSLMPVITITAPIAFILVLCQVIYEC